MRVFWASLQIIVFKKSANSACTAGLYATRMYGEVEDLTLHIKTQHTNWGKYPTSRSKYTSTTPTVTFTAKDVSGGSASGFHSQDAGFESTRPILSGIFHGPSHSLQTNPAQQIWAIYSMVSTSCRRRIYPGDRASVHQWPRPQCRRHPSCWKAHPLLEGC